ncbi:MAG: hypothetical protein AAB348_00450 [Patescibacteria group bacterium]
MRNTIETGGVAEYLGATDEKPEHIAGEILDPKELEIKADIGSLIEKNKGMDPSLPYFDKDFHDNERRIGIINRNLHSLEESISEDEKTTSKILAKRGKEIVKQGKIVISSEVVKKRIDAGDKHMVSLRQQILDLKEKRRGLIDENLRRVMAILEIDRPEMAAKIEQYRKTIAQLQNLIHPHEALFLFRVKTLVMERKQQREIKSDEDLSQVAMAAKDIKGMLRGEFGEVVNYIDHRNKLYVEKNILERALKILELRKDLYEHYLEKENGKEK